MIFVVLLKQLNCAVDKTIGTGHTINTNYNTNFRMMLLMMLFNYFLVQAFEDRPI